MTVGYEATTAPVRAFTPEDYPRLVEVSNLVYPDYPETLEEIRHQDDTWPERYFRMRLAVEDGDGGVAGFGWVSHMQSQYHPQKYYMEINIDPARQRRGYGSALYERLTAELRHRSAIAVRAEAKESMPESVSFLAHRGFVEVERDWESRLPVAGFEFERFAGAEERVSAQGITITTLAEERVRHPEVLRDVYEMHIECLRDVPALEPITDIDYEQFLAREIDAPGALPEAYFLAKDGDRLIGESVLERSQELPNMLYQGLTGVRRAYRGKGIAMALKLRTVRYAREHGIGEIRTWNSTRNQPMLAINVAMGFVRQPAWIGFLKEMG